MTRTMIALNVAGRSLVAAGILILAADRALSRMNARQRALLARVRSSYAR